MKSLYSERYRRLLTLLVEARHARGLSQQAVAAKLKRHQSFVSKYESGERRLDVVEFLILSEAIGFDPIRLITSINASSRDARTRRGHGRGRP